VEAYRDDLAYIHDVGFGDFARTAAPALLEMLRRGGVTEGLVVDLGCGTGSWAEALVTSGYDVLGIDISPAMVDIARKSVPTGEFHTGSFLGRELPRCVAVTSLGECFNYLFDGANSRKELVRLFRRTYDALHSNGLFIFDLLEPDYLRGVHPQAKQWEGDDWMILLRLEEDQKRRMLTRHITSFRKVGESYRRDDERHRLRLFEGSAIAKDLRSVGFRVRIVRGYGPLRFRKAHVGLLARKP
jgi:SAM-dependent methyltransferase